MPYRLDVSADVLLPRFLFHAKKAQENFKIFESRASTNQITLPLKKLDDLKLVNQKTCPIKKLATSFYKQKLQFCSAWLYSCLINIKR